MVRKPNWKGLGVFFAVALATTLALFTVLVDFRTITVNQIVVYLLVTLLAALLTSVVSFLIWTASAKLLGRIWRKLLIKLVWRELRKRYSDFSAGLPAKGIGQSEGSVVVGIGLGEANGIVPGS